MMDVSLMFILCCFTGISAQPGLDRIKRESKIIEGDELNKEDARKTRTWPESPDMFHLPKPFSLKDKIEVAIETKDSERLNISFVTDQNATEASTIGTFVADLKSSMFTFHHNNEIVNITYDKNLFLDGTIFSITFEREENLTTQESNILFIQTFDINNITSMDNIRYIKISGDKIKVNEIKFKFA